MKLFACIRVHLRPILLRHCCCCCCCWRSIESCLADSSHSGGTPKSASGSGGASDNPTRTDTVSSLAAFPLNIAFSRRNIGIIAADRRADMPRPRPANCWSDRTRPIPSPGSSASTHAWLAPSGGPVRRIRARIQIPAHVPAGNPHVTHQSDHDVREILAHALARFDRLIDRRIHARRFRNIFEPVIDRLVQLS